MRSCCCNMKHMTADITQNNHTESSADVGLQSPHRLSGFNSTIIHTIDTDVTRRRKALSGLHASSQKVWLTDPRWRGKSKVRQTSFLIQYKKNYFCRLYYNRNIHFDSHFLSGFQVIASLFFTSGLFTHLHILTLTVEKI